MQVLFYLLVYMVFVGEVIIRGIFILLDIGLGVIELSCEFVLYCSSCWNWLKVQIESVR